MIAAADIEEHGAELRDATRAEPLGVGLFVGAALLLAPVRADDVDSYGAITVASLHCGAWLAIATFTGKRGRLGWYQSPDDEAPLHVREGHDA